jgi:RecQ family ATP-dependent DNA helicase
MPQSREEHLQDLLRQVGPCSDVVLLAAARQRWPGLSQTRLRTLVIAAIRAGLVREADGVLSAVRPETAEVPEPAASSTGTGAPATPVTVDPDRDTAGPSPADGDPDSEGTGPRRTGRRPGLLRAVVVDVESVVRPSAEHPHGEKRMYQIGAVRLSADTGWEQGTPRFGSWVRLPGADWEDEIRSPQVREQYSAHAEDPAHVLDELRGFLTDVDVLVAYNGTGADFRILDEAALRAEQPPLGGVRRSDALYLAHVVWPHAGSHRLAALADAVGVDTLGLSWHDAGDDAELTARLLRHAATTVAGWDPDLRDLVCAVGAGSAAWDLLTALLPDPPVTGPVDDAAVAQTIAGALTGTAAGSVPVRRGRPVPALEVPAAVCGPDGVVDPHALAQAAAHGTVERRAAQQQMTALLTTQIGRGRDALCEAPTGTGKSFAVLAAALRWLAGDPARTAVIATYTKALQSQLAGDVDRLTTAIPGLVTATDLVKGAVNRLSLRALVTALADATDPDARRPAGSRSAPGGARAGRTVFAAHPGYRELLTYLVARLAFAGTVVQGWAARSADPVDLPVFLTSYLERTCGPYAGVWLRSISQEADDYDRDSPSPLATLTGTAAEALAGHRLVIANHALLMASPDVFAPGTLLVVDEAHSLEQAATGAASAVVEYRLVEHLVADLRRWTLEHRDAPAELVAAIGDLEAQLDTEVLPRSAQALFDTAGTEPGSRAATLASPFGGLGGNGPARQLLHRLRALAAVARGVHRMLAGYLQTPEVLAAPWWQRERTRSLTSRVAALVDAAAQIVDDAAEILDDPTGNSPGLPESSAMPVVDAQAVVLAPATGGSQSSARPAQTGQDSTGETDADGELPDAVSTAEEQLAVDADTDLGPEAEAGLPVPDGPNRVVYATEQDLTGLTVSARRYVFSVGSAPIELARDPQWADTRGRFERIFYVSATLQVAGQWTYIRDRLGLGDDVDAHTLDGPFDLAEQARLVCFSDFPSWAEQADGAVRTVAHQLAGYAAEVIRPYNDPRLERAGDRDGAGFGEGGFGSRYTGGALVLTTATRAASAITERLLTELPARAPGIPVAAAPVLGNARAAAAFTTSGGFCVATRGMWQGVDFPADRLSLVWINKLPFAPFADPVIAARRASAARRAADAGHPDPERAATEAYYLPLAAMDLRQAVGRLIRSRAHRGIIVISDRKLAGLTALRRSYRRIFLESLDPGLLIPAPDHTGSDSTVNGTGAQGGSRDTAPGEPGGGNVVTMADGWQRIWTFLATHNMITTGRAGELCTPEALDEHTLLPATRKIRQARISPAEHAAATAAGTLGDLLADRCAQIAGYLRFSDDPLPLKPEQVQVIRAVAAGNDVLALLPTGFGKSYTFQLPALALPGVTVVVSPLIALMADQALELNASVGGAVRALVAPLAESNSRRGKTEVAEQLSGTREYGIKLIYISPERLGNRRFQELLRTAAAAGILRRVAVDEAHTFVQWGDDFRPSFRRAAQLLAELRARHGVAVTAVTATANRAVRDGLRTGLFGLSATPADAEPLLTVAANPLRPELAIYRRTLATGGQNAVAGLTEQVASATTDHTIFYCLTVKEVDAVYAHLREFVGDGTRRVRRFHGRLAEAEKAAVLAEFRDAPTNGEDGFAPLLIVATSAFGLGVNRADIRCVFVVSPPTDLAALYQQLGRAGRDQAGRDPATVTIGSYGLALGTGRGFRTVAWMAAQGLQPATLRAVGDAVLAAARSGGVLDPDRVADTCVAADLAAGRLTRDEARRPATVAQYRSTVIRALAALAETGAVDDGGDFPATITLTPLDDPARCAEHTLTAVAAVAASLPGGRHRLTDLHRQLNEQVPGYRLIADDPAATWAILATLHDLGVTDVSQAGNNRTLVAVRARHTFGRLPDDFVARMTAHRARLRTELADLHAWYTAGSCANEGFAAYFAIGARPALPAGVCSTPVCRCSSCWDASTDLVPSPALRTALNTPRPTPAARRDGAPYRQAADRYVRSLLWDNYRGLTAAMIHRVLRGDETYLSAASGRRRPLWPNLLYHRLRGVDPGIRLPHVLDALDRLVATGEVVASAQGVWRLRRHVDRDAVRAAQAARQAGQQTAAGGGPSDTSMPADQRRRDDQPAPDRDAPGRPGGHPGRAVRS